MEAPPVRARRFTSDNLHAVLFVSRNKDNDRLPGFKPRTRAQLKPFNLYTPDGLQLLSDETIGEQVQQEFTEFMWRGMLGEMARIYVSINPRDPEKTRFDLIRRLLPPQPVSLPKLGGLAASIASKPENRSGDRWLLDWDAEQIDPDFLQLLVSLGLHPICRSTPHGWAIIVEHGFDTRLIDRSLPVTVKKDGMLCVGWGMRKN